MYDITSLIIIATILLAGGILKGVAGLGLPIVAVTGLTFFFGIQNAIAITIIPAFVANLIQAVDGRHPKKIVGRTAAFIIPAMITTWGGTIMLAYYTDVAVLALAVILLVYSISGTFGLRVDITERQDKWVAPVIGAICGIANGMTGVASPPTIIYLNGIKMGKDELVQALGITFLALFVALAICLWFQGLFDLTLATLGTFAIIPTIIGQWIGRTIRTQLSEKMFQYILYRILILVAAYLVIKTIISGG